MSRIPDSDLDTLKSTIPLAALVRDCGIELRPHGQDLIGHCPFHDDKTPSLVVSPSKNLWNCLGACGVGGSVIDWVMKREDLDFRAAVAKLQVQLPATKSASKPPKWPKRPKCPAVPAIPADSDAQEALRKVIDFYHDSLWQHAGAMAYLKSRCLDDEALLKHFKIGFSDRSLGLMLPEKNRQAGATIRGQLCALGVLRPSGHEHFRGSITIPVIAGDGSGAITEIYGRKITRGLRSGTPLHTYLKGPHRGVFNEAGIATACESGNRTLILCESLIDALSFWRFGYKNVTSSFGINGFTEDLLGALGHYTISTLLIAYDADAAGDIAAEKLCMTLAKSQPQLSCKRVRFPRDMDANGFVYKMMAPQEALHELVQQAELMDGLEIPLVQVGAPAAPSSLAASTVAPNPTPGAAAPVAPVITEPTTAVETSAPPTTPELTAPTPATPATTTPATPTPVAAAASTPESSSTIIGDEVSISLGARLWRLRGLFDNPSNAHLKINLGCSKSSGPGGAADFYVDTLDLYSAKARAGFVRYCAEELEDDPRVIKGDMAKVLREAELLWQARQAENEAGDIKELSPEEHDEALALLKSEDLLEQVLADFKSCGVVGEETNKLLGYLAASSRMLDKPLAIIIQSTSAAGKSSLMEAILQMIPEEERVQYSSMTGQSVFYLGETNLKHKILAIAEEEGAEKASYALKVLQSEGELSIASTGKDPKSGRLITQTYRVEGPVMLFLTTTAIDIDEEFLNRCLVLSVDEDKGQTRAIHKAQRFGRTVAGMISSAEQGRILNRQQNAQRLLRRLKVVNPFAELLSFADHATRTRRDHAKYLTLIDAIAFVYQYQRPLKTLTHKGEAIDYIEVQQGDIDLANKIGASLFSRSLDALPPQTRRLLGLIEEMSARACREHDVTPADYRFTRRMVREHTHWGNTQLKVHLRRLEELEYLVVHRGGPGQRYTYEVAFAAAGPAGLPEVSQYDEDSSKLGGGGRPLVGGGRGGENGSKSLESKGNSETGSTNSRNAHEGENAGIVIPESIVDTTAKTKKHAS